MSRCIRLHMTVSQENMGSVVIALADQVSNVDFEIVEDVPFHKNGKRAPKDAPRLRPEWKRQTAVGPTQSKIPPLFKDYCNSHADISVGTIKQILKSGGLSPTSYSHAVIVLRREGMIESMAEKGLYKVRRN